MDLLFFAVEPMRSRRKERLVADNQLTWKPGDDIESVLREIFEQTRRERDQSVMDCLAGLACVLSAIQGLSNDDLVTNALRKARGDVVEIFYYLQERLSLAPKVESCQEPNTENPVVLPVSGAIH